MSKLILIDDFAPKDEYELDEIVQNDRGLTIKFNGVIHRIIVNYEHKWIWFSSSDEADRWRTLSDYFSKEPHKDTELFYVDRESDLKRWIVNEKYGVWNYDELEHHVFVTINDVIEVVSRSRPCVQIIR